MDMLQGFPLTNNARLTAAQGRAAGMPFNGRKALRRLAGLSLVLVLLVGLAGCESDEDCISCVELPPPVVPTGVHSISGNNEVIVQWYDISYAPYDDSYNENVTAYYIYSRFYEFGDEYDPDREFFFIGEVAWDENYDPGSGLHWFIDDLAENGLQYEYAVAAVNAAGRESALSFEFVADAPLPMSPLDGNGWHIPTRVYDQNGPNPSLAAFHFRQAALNPNVLTAGVVAPTGAHNIRISFEGGVPYVIADAATTRIQDFGVFAAPGGPIVFEGVSWAPEGGYSLTGKIELVPGHVYVVEIVEPGSQELHYAKFGIQAVNNGSVDLIWAYQLIEGLPELKVPDAAPQKETRPQVMKL